MQIKREEQCFDVIVVGAGLSGLRAAVDAHRAGLSVLVLEARERVGGKTLSLEASPGHGKVDVGAAWINDTNQSEMYAMAKEFGFDLVKQRDTGDNVFQMPDGAVLTYPHGGQVPASAEDGVALKKFLSVWVKHLGEEDPENPYLSPAAAELDSKTFRQYALDACTGNQFVVFYIDYLCAALLGVQSDEVSALYMTDYVMSGTGLTNLTSDTKDGGQYLRNRQGNQTFSKCLAAQLPKGSLHTSSPVGSIIQHEHDCTVVAQGIHYTARRVIVSIPTPFYTSIHFDPPLPPSKHLLSDSTALGYYAKTILVFARPWWREAGLSGIIEFAGPIMFSRDTCVPEDEQYSITCFIVGDLGRAWSKWSVTERRAQVMTAFDATLGKTARERGVDVPKPTNVIEKEWIKDEWSRGAPSPVMLPGVLTSDAGKTLREPFDKVHFVGTETATVWKGYMEGAVRSGIRGAKEVVAALKPQ